MILSPSPQVTRRRKAVPVDDQRRRSGGVLSRVRSLLEREDGDAREVSVGRVLCLACEKGWRYDRAAFVQPHLRATKFGHGKDQTGSARDRYSISENKSRFEHA